MSSPGGESFPNHDPAANPQKSRPSLLRFGVFEADVRAGELRKNGSRVRLQEQPFQVLVVLLENAGNVVTREDLRQKVWPADTFVDFDHSLNTAVNKIRESLGDSASSPRFVETLARRGYRFIAPVDFADADGSPARSGNSTGAVAPTLGAAGPDPRVAGPKGVTLDEVAIDPDLHVPIPRRALVRTLFALIQGMYLCFYLSALDHLRDVERVATKFLTGREPAILVGAVLVTGAIGIPLRCYLISSVAFDFRRLGATLRRLFPFILILDQLWAVAPFLLIPQIGVGLAFAATAALLYVPFSERTLIRMAYHER